MGITLRLFIATTVALLILFGADHQRAVHNQTIMDAQEAHRLTQITTHDFMLTKGLFEQWFMTIDLFLVDRTLYLATIIHKQNAQLEKIINEQLMMEVPDHGRFLLRHLSTVQQLLNQLTAKDGQSAQLITEQYFEERVVIEKKMGEITLQLEQQQTAAQQQLALLTSNQQWSLLIIAGGTLSLLLFIAAWLYKTVCNPLQRLASQAHQSHQQLRFQPTNPGGGCMELDNISHSINHLVERLTDARMRLVVEKHQHQSLHHSFQALANTAPAAVFIVLQSGSVQYMNKAAYNMFGLLKDDAEQVDIGELIPALDGEKLMQIKRLHRVISTGIRRDGGTLKLRIHASCFDEDSPRYMLIVDKHTVSVAQKRDKD